MGGSDPVASGLVESFARPGGNITGVADLDTDLAPKRLEIFRELIPGLKRILFPYHEDELGAATNVNLHREAARRLGLTLVERPLGSQAKAQDLLGSVRRGDVDGIFSPRSVALNLPAFILDASTRFSIPAMFHDSIWVEQGGLASYSANTYQVGRQAARLLDRIIRGAKPGDLPVERATRFDLVINLRTARALNLVVPQSLLLRVDRTIE
jgi:putative ABC transport system substrate-binding protein